MCAEGARDGVDDAIGGDFANQIVAAVADVDIAGRINGDARRKADLRVDGGTAIAREIEVAARDGCDDAVGGDFADAVVECVGDEEIAGVVEGDAGGIEETAVALPPSPEKPAMPLPAMVVMAPPETLRMRALLKSAM